MKSIIITLVLVIISSVCFGQKNSTPNIKMTRLDTAKVLVYNDSVNTVNVVNDFKNIIFKDIKAAQDYDFLKSLLDKYMDEKRKIWETFLNKNK